MANKYQADKPNILLLEGTNDWHVVVALCECHQLPENFGLWVCDGDAGVLKKLKALLDKREAYTAIGVVLDADAPDLAAKWQGFMEVLKQKGMTCPLDAPDENGTLIPKTDEYPALGLWLMPDNRADGMLEDFCLALASGGAVGFAQACVSSAQAQGHASFKANHHSKAVVHTLLAWQDEPGRPLGQAVAARVLNPDLPLAKRFADWLESLFMQ
jgi:hypothetical protein